MGRGRVGVTSCTNVPPFRFLDNIKTFRREVNRVTRSEDVGRGQTRVRARVSFVSASLAAFLRSGFAIGAHSFEDTAGGRSRRDFVLSHT